MKRRWIRLMFLIGVIAWGFILWIRWPSILPDRSQAGADEPVVIDIESDPKLLIQSSLEAYGGIDLIKRIQGLRLESTIILHRNSPDPLQGRAIEYYRFPDRSRTEITIGKRTKTHIYDGLNAWTVEGEYQVQGEDFVAEGLRTSIKNIPILLLQEALDERSILEPIVLDNLDGEVVFVVPVNNSGGAQYWLWFNSKSYLLERLDYTLITSRGPSAMQVRFEKYREFDGIQTASRITFIRDGTITQETRVEKADYNPELPESLFTVPGREK